MADLESHKDPISVSITRAEAAALGAVAANGLDAEEAHRKTLNTASAERALRELRGSHGALMLSRAEAAALIAVAEGGLALSASPRGLFAPLFEEIDLSAARRGLDQLREAYQVRSFPTRTPGP